MKIVNDVGCGIKDIIDSLLGGVEGIIDVVLRNINELIKTLLGVPPMLLNQIGIQRLGAIMTLTTYCYMIVMSIVVSPTFFTIMLALNGLHAGKSIYGKGVNSNSK